MPPVNPVGRAIDAAAQGLYDSQLVAPQDNKAGNPEIAERAAQQISAFLRAAITSRTVLDDKMTIFYELWNGGSASFYYPQSRSVHVPEPFKVVEAGVCRLVEILTGSLEWFRAVGIDELGKKNADIRGKLLKSQLRLDGFQRKFRQIIRDCLTYGWAPSKTRWKFRRRTIKYRDIQETPVMDEGAQTGTTPEIQERTVEVNMDGPTLEPCDVFRFFVDLRYHDHQDGPGLMFESEITEEELLEYGNRGIYANVEKVISDENPEIRVPANGPLGTAMNPATFRRIRDASNGVVFSDDMKKPVSRRYMLYEYWGKFDPAYDESTQSQGTEEEWQIILGGKMHDKTGGMRLWPLLICKNPYWHGQRPGLVAHFIRRSQSFASMGLIEPIVKLSAELDDLRNMGLAGTALSAKPFFIATDDAEIGGNNLVIDPGTVLRARSTESIKATFAPDRSQVAYMGEAICKQDIAETAAVPKLFEGSPEGAKETATSTVTRTREANKRLTEAARNIADHFLIPLLEQWDAMNAQMITTERAIEIIGEDGLNAGYEKIGPAQVAGRLHFEVTAMPQIEMAGIEARMLIQFTGVAMQAMQMMPGAFNPEPMLRRAYEKSFGRVGMDEAFPLMDRPKELRSTHDEHYLLGMGHDVETQQDENIWIHLQGHLKFMSTRVFMNWEPDNQRRFIAHVENTKVALRRFMEKVAQRMPSPPGGMPAPPEGPGAGRPVVPGAAALRGPSPTPEGQVRSSAAMMEPRPGATEL